MPYRTFNATDRWLTEAAPAVHVAVSSRARFARNLAGFPFAPHAKADTLKRIDDYVTQAIARSEYFREYERIEIAQLSAIERAYLKESRLISKEMERGGAHLTVYMAPDALASILVNEEDHLRLQVIAPGLQLQQALARLNEVDAELGKVVGYAYSEKFGYLTACPSNVGTGLRGSVMLHLPGLSQLQEIESSLQGIAHYGLTVRGFHGENTDFAGDFYQISNEMTLGKSVEQIAEVLLGVIARVIEREEEARLTLFKNHATATNDRIWRSYALLRHARRIDSTEAIDLLSRLRLGIDRGYFNGLKHHELNRLIMEVQPAHLERKREDWGSSNSRDEARANLLRQWLPKAPVDP